MIDAQGYPGTQGENGEFDGGDTAAIIGTIETLASIDESQEMPRLPSYYGIFNTFSLPLRHPDKTKWYGQPDRFSRDQLIPNICGLIKTDEESWLYYAHKQRFFLTAWNTKGNGLMDMPLKFPDICGPEVWALWIRYKRPIWARLILNILDLQTLVGAIQWRWFESASNRVTRNHMLVSIVARRHSPTLISRLVYWLNDWDDLISRWDAHCDAVKEFPTSEYFLEAVKDPGAFVD